MSEYLKKFSIEDVQMYNEQKENIDFSIVEIWALANDNNSHRNPISIEVLEKYADTFKGKFIVAKFDEMAMDVKGHETDEIIVGYIDPRESIEFKTKFVEKENKEKEFVVVKALLSKIYARNVVDMFRLDNERTVSCEFSCKTMYEENEYGQPIDEFGRVLNEDNPILKYNIHAITILGKSFNPSVVGTEIKVKQFAESLSKQTLKEFAKKRKKYLDKDYSLNKNKEDNMEENKMLSKSESDKEEKDIIMEEEAKEEKEMAEVKDTEAEEKEMAETEEQPKDEKEEEEKEMGCGKDMSDDSEEKEMEEKEEETDKEDEEDKEKNFSLDAFVDQSAILVMLENETEQYKDLVEKMTKEFSANEIVETFVKLSKENDALKAEKEKADKEKQEKKFSAIMASVKEDLDEKVFSELSEEGKELSLEQLGAFENKVKAFAYEATKSKQVKKEESDIMMFGASDDTINNNDNQDVFDRLSKM